MAHAVLRGSVNKRGVSLPNYHYEDLQTLLELYNERELRNPACIVDANHSNSNKQFKEQIRIVKEVVSSIARICIFLRATIPASGSGFFSGSGCVIIPLYPSPVVLGLLV